MKRFSLILVAFSCLMMASCSGPKEKLLGRWQSTAEGELRGRFQTTVGMMDLGTIEFSEAGTLTTTTKTSTYFARYTIIDATTLEIEDTGLEVNGKKTEYEKGKGGTTKVQFSISGDALTLTPADKSAQPVSFKRIK